MYPQRYFGALPPFPRTLTAFVIMSFDARFNSRWESVIKPAIKAVSVGGQPLEPYRTDATMIGDSILTDILSRISTARVIVADLTTMATFEGSVFRNGNVMYELGLAHAVRQPEEVVLLRSDADRLLFDVSNVRVNPYDPDNDADGARKVVARAIVTAIDETRATLMLSVRQASSALDAVAWELLLQSESSKDMIPQPRRRTMGEVLTNTASTSAIQRMLELNILQAEFIKREVKTREEAHALQIEHLVQYRVTEFGRAVRARMAGHLQEMLTLGPDFLTGA